MRLPIKISLIVLFVVISSLLLFTMPAVAADEDILCGSDSDDASNTISTIFLILAGLGPVLGTLFWVALSVAESASIDSDKSQQKRKVIVAGFSVPIAIAFANAIASELIGVNVSCFFPDIG